MVAPRFFCETPLRADGRIELPPATAHHVLRVRRLREGTPIVLFDGHGGEYPATLRVERQRAWADMLGFQPLERELAGHLVLIQGLPSSERMDWVIEKAVELGVAELYPVRAERSVLRLSGERAEKRLARWRAIVQSASEQCGRNQLMHVHAPDTLAACLARLDGPLLLADPAGTPDLTQALAPVSQRLALAVGPEGGWSPDERTLARARPGTHCIRFGSRVLRSETAGLALASAVTTLLGWQADPADQPCPRPE